MKLICGGNNNTTFEFVIAEDLDIDLIERIQSAKGSEKINVAFKEIKKRLHGNLPTNFHPRTLIE